MVIEKDFDRQELIRELLNLTVIMLNIVEAPGFNHEDLLSVLARRGQLIEQLKKLPFDMNREAGWDGDPVKELLYLDSKLKQRFEEKYQELREAMAVLQKRKASQNLYRKKGVLAGGLFLDNKR
ncbi:hypothetical protein [Desulfolucanica intricata]|uniref:hypothetical protein n=1 Tax=Desulfolucanica intricata TaxID=1285191 RepID=UPI00082B7668|nr:hypothetical protein [Desulfolucanica intricata]